LLLTLDQKNALTAVKETVLMQCGCSPIAKSEGSPVPFEQAMVNLLLMNWTNGTTAAKKAILQGLVARGGKLSQPEMDTILFQAQNRINATFVLPTVKKTPGLFTGSYKAAKKNITARHNKKFNYVFRDTSAGQWLTDHHNYWIGNYYNRFISKSIAEVAAQGLAQNLGRETIGRNLSEFFNDYPGVPFKPDYYWRGLAANAMNRSRQFGMISGFEDVGAISLQILAVNDERTSEVCRELDGKIFPLGRAVNQRNMLMTAENPDEVKQISPWLSAEEIKGKSTKEINDLGVVMPPFHFYCRTTTIEIISKTMAVFNGF